MITTDSIRFRSRPAGVLAAALCLALLVPTVAWSAGGSSKPTAPSKSETKMPEDHYNQGLKHRDAAWALEKEASQTGGKAAEKLLAKARKEYENAVRAQREAIAGDATFYQAHSSLGYALRKLGEYDESIAAYDRALSISPGYTEAIEYRAEAYLGLGRLEDAKEAYLILIREDQARADELMTAMKKWLAGQRSGGSEVSPSDLDAFASWVEERADVAAHAAMVSRANARDW